MPLEVAEALWERPWTDEDIIEHLTAVADRPATGLMPVRAAEIEKTGVGRWALTVDDDDIARHHTGPCCLPEDWTQEQAKQAAEAGTWVFIPLEANGESPERGRWIPIEATPQDELLWEVPIGAYGTGRLAAMLEEGQGEPIAMWRAGELFSYLSGHQQEVEARERRLVDQLCEKRGVNKDMKLADPARHKAEKSWAEQQARELAMYDRL